MSQDASSLLIVDDRLRYVLYGICVSLDISISAQQIERVFTHCHEGDSSERSYVFHESRRAEVLGRSDAYEPETVCLKVRAKGFNQASLERLVSLAEHASFARQDLREAT